MTRGAPTCLARMLAACRTVRHTAVSAVVSAATRRRPLQELECCSRSRSLVTWARLQDTARREVPALHSTSRFGKRSCPPGNCVALAAALTAAVSRRRLRAVLATSAPLAQPPYAAALRHHNRPAVEACCLAQPLHSATSRSGCFHRPGAPGPPPPGPNNFVALKREAWHCRSATLSGASVFWGSRGPPPRRIAVACALRRSCASFPMALTTAAIVVRCAAGVPPISFTSCPLVGAAGSLDYPFFRSYRADAMSALHAARGARLIRVDP